jgi:hypothetical protein
VALLLYVGLGVATLREVGLVGEVVRTWTDGAPAQVVVATDPWRWADGAASNTVGHRWGPLVASQVRPVETLRLGSVSVPLAVNQYTSGLPDWPAQWVYALTGSVGAVLGLHWLLGGLLIVLVHRFLRFHGTDVAAAIAALLLATDWGFLFYRRALGGTEVLLQAAGVLCLWALWSRRWAGGAHGLNALGVGIGLGLLAKLTFGITVVALGLTALLLRRDKPPLRPPLPAQPWLPFLLTMMLVLPLGIAALHHGLAVPVDPHVVSHDFGSAQWARVWNALTGGPTPARESVAALYAWIGDGSVFLETAYGAQHTGSADALRWLGWAPILGGVALAWRDRHPTPHIALLRFAAVFLLLQVGLLWWVARDLHHLAQAAPTLAIVAGLALDRLAGRISPPRSPARARASLIFALPWMIAGVVALWRTDDVLRTVNRPTVTRSGQASVVDMVRRSGVERLVVCDYELAGVLEAFLPEVDVVHGWALASRVRGRAIEPLLTHAAGGHLLSIPAAPAWTYNLKFRRADLEAAASRAGVAVAEVDRPPDGGAVLYTVHRRRDSL